MIEKIRKPKKSRNVINYIIYTLIFGMIIASFVFMIPGMTGSSGAVNTAAEVGKTTISLRSYTDQLRMMRSQYQKMFRGEIPAFFESNLKSQVIESLVQAEVMKQFAKNEGIIVSDLEISNFLKNEIDAFQEDGRFSLNRYNNYLKSVRLSPAKFEERIYNDLLRAKLQSVFNAAFMASQTEEEIMSSMKDYNLSFQYLEYDPSLFKNSVKVSDKQVSEFLASDEGEKEVKNYYTKNAELKYMNPEKAQVSYILFDSMKKAKEIGKNLNQENFSEMAKKHSQDALSKSQGGDIGYIEKGELSNEIEAKAFSMKPSTVSKPFQTSEGPVIVWLRDKKKAKMQDFKTIKKDVAKEFLEDKAIRVAQSKVDELMNQKNPAALVRFLTNAGHKWSDVKSINVLDEKVKEVGPVSEFFDSIVELNAEGVTNQLISVQDSKFLFKNKGLKEVSGDKEKAPKGPQGQKSNLLASNAQSRGSDVYFLVYQNEKKEKDIQINQQLVAE